MWDVRICARASWLEEEEAEGCHGTLLARGRRSFHGWLGGCSLIVQTVMLDARVLCRMEEQLLHGSQPFANTREREVNGWGESRVGESILMKSSICRGQLRRCRGVINQLSTGCALKDRVERSILVKSMGNGKVLYNHYCPVSSAENAIPHAHGYSCASQPPESSPRIPGAV
jgi:hypothetical protein